LPVLRPLLTNDKAETIALAQRIGTYETSIQPYEDCCSLFVPAHPATRARLDDVERAEAGLDVAAMARELYDKLEVIVVRPAAATCRVGKRARIARAPSPGASPGKKCPARPSPPPK